MARYIGEEGSGPEGGAGRLVFRCWAHKQPDMKEAGEGWKEFYRLFCLRTGVTGVIPVPPIPTSLPTSLPPSLPASPTALTGGAFPHPPPLLPVPPAAYAGMGGDAEGRVMSGEGGRFGEEEDGGEGGGEGGGRGVVFVPPGGLPGPRVEKKEEEEEEEEEEEMVMEEEEEGERAAGKVEENGGVAPLLVHREI
ncbi:hypothetical protein NSK_008164 [Nannochloropsis salina CCMP1776]|uniref:Uncharacterized protein n=1 Tax=Nannochloropsis salina CCMP1776 TaxID=1027361 RepID=A0A4D9CSB7_9STRA|nr:hypothetical protein NSK_008164 [Nannochloropsis salina CCMP1776]|eukprot:TFJ80423.1 hypothetical protein NSK_008164 [Nannochloropsis salina CCMP1776]